LLSQACWIAEAASCRVRSIAGGNACFDLLLAAQIDMELHLFGKIASRLVPVEQHAEAPLPFSEPAHRHLQPG
jgi:hypothetical protein